MTGPWEHGATDLVTEPVRVRAHAKLTLTLRVLGVRGDGYHDLEALTASVAEPADLVEVALRGDGRSTLQVAGTVEDVPAGGENLAARAAHGLLRRVEPGAGARVRLKKVIPAGAGLGGGSADAAAVLIALTRLLPSETDGFDLHALGAELGSDVPFCLEGGMAWMRGRGELIEPVELAEQSPPPIGVVIAVPPVRLATPAVYRRWDELGGPASDRRVPAPPGLADVTSHLFNDLEPAAVDLEPALTDFRRDLEEAAGGPAAMLAGSGSSFAVVVDDVAAARQMAVRIEDALASATVFVGGISGAGVTLV